MTPHDVESIERATLAAVPPEQLTEHAGWLLAMDAGTVWRSHSAVPLRHEGAAAQAVDEVIKTYRATGFKPCFRLARVEGLAAVRDRLKSLGLKAERPTQVQIAPVDQVLALGEQGTSYGVQVLREPDQAWSAVFLGEGFDPQDGAHRVRILSRAKDAAYATVKSKGQAVACGTASFSHGWASVHGMRTLPDYRGQGLATSILATLAQEARTRSVEQMFLQVEESNTSAQRLYAQAGFSTAWVYEYWR